MRWLWVSSRCPSVETDSTSGLGFAASDLAAHVHPLTTPPTAIARPSGCKRRSEPITSPSQLVAGRRQPPPEATWLRALLLPSSETAVHSSYAPANLDLRSFRLNFELGVVVYEKQFTDALAQRFEVDLEQSREVTGEALAARGTLSRIGDGIAWLFSPLL